MNRRVISMIPLLVAAAIFTYVTRSPAAVVLVVPGAIVSLWIAPRLDAGAFGQRLTLLVIGVLGALLGSALLVNASGIGPTGLASLWGTIAFTAIFLALARRFFRKPEGGEKPDFALLAVSMVASGEKRSGLVYIACATLFVAAVIAVVRAKDANVTWRLVEGNSPRALLAILVMVFFFTAASMTALPRIEEFTQHQLERVMFASSESRTGFTDRLRLGAADRILESDELVMRVYGPHTDYLRGQVYNRYNVGSWETTSDRPPTEVATVVGRPTGAAVIEVRAVGDSSARERRPRYFIPLGAHRIGTTRGFAWADPLGTLRPLAGDAPSPIYFEPGQGDLPVAKPTDEDLRVPDDLRATLSPLVSAWTEGKSTPRQKLLAIERHLTHEFTYSLEHDYPKRRDEPYLVHFLIHSRRGHCEYFSTAMALLARYAGIPARVVGGYRVAEHNVLGGYDVVREKNAHAWVEAWVEGEGWQTFEPTPTQEANISHPSGTLGALGDVLASAWDRAIEAVLQASLWQILGSLAAAVGLLTVVRRLRARREKRKGEADEGETSLPLACFTRLEAALAGKGHVRSPSDSLEQFARRLNAADLGPAADLVLRYGAYRYGGIGEPRVVAEEIDAYASALASPSK